jgi:hypothetical protein
MGTGSGPEISQNHRTGLMTDRIIADHLSVSEFDRDLFTELMTMKQRHTTRQAVAISKGEQNRHDDGTGRIVH